jgi:hypothetical protein
MFDILFLEEIFLNEYLETLNELCMISDNFKPIIKFPRGRPLKYITEKEKKQAKKEYMKKYMKTYNIKKNKLNERIINS